MTTKLCLVLCRRINVMTSRQQLEPRKRLLAVLVLDLPLRRAHTHTHTHVISFLHAATAGRLFPVDFFTINKTNVSNIGYTRVWLYLNDVGYCLEELHELGEAVVRHTTLLAEVVVIGRDELVEGHLALWAVLQQIDHLQRQLLRPLHLVGALL